ncbi:hypothetical protein [Clostridium cellulovorans]|uniref:Butirosin biosynthesis protein H N-terminal domain-containing protein n=1 Tax=Clostridium cellulovorans (strain ATCC 35296 / DSM 3052 / OCM 3 / 743B) TaxID=573061 RepID=D9STS6_CLOC7|nr:hypothetical protein [Clostridium cellulovorans]ADL52810.1 hypothetical protein Clocel_3121 [Clostridium cellulovorans 743B]
MKYDFEPFNDFYFINCYYNAMFSLLNKFKRDISEVLLDFKSTYIIENNFINIVVKEQDEPYKYWAQKGITVEQGIYSDNIISDIIEVLKDQDPVILWIDGYYQPLIVDLYHKQHWLHALLIVGYEDNNFHVVEHSHKDSLNYQVNCVSKEDLMEMIKGYVTYFKEIKKYPVYSVYKKSDFNSSLTDSDKKYKLYSIAKENFDSYNRCIKEISKSEIYQKPLEEETVMSIITNMGNFINVKKSFSYMCKMIEKDNIILNKNIDEYIEFIEKTRTRILKDYYLGKEINLYQNTKCDYYEVIKNYEEQILLSLKNQELFKELKNEI